MSLTFEGNAILYCEQAFGTLNGKTAHGLVRRSHRYRVLCVVDSRLAGKDAGEVLDGRSNGIPIVKGIAAGIRAAEAVGNRATHLIVGLAPDGGRLTPGERLDIRNALELGLNIVSGLHDYLSDDPVLVEIARQKNVRIRDIRRPPPTCELHFFSDKIREVTSPKIAVLGTDSAVGKRTTAWMLVDAIRAAGRTAEMVGTGQTAWLQGAQYGFLLDSIINDFLSGEIEHAVWLAWNEQRPEVLVIEGQGSLMNPAYPGGYEICAAARPDGIILQHAPARRDYDGFPGYPIHPIERQIQALEIISSKKVIAITVNHESLSPAETDAACTDITAKTGLPAIDVLRHGAESLLPALFKHLHTTFLPVHA